MFYTGRAFLARRALNRLGSRILSRRAPAPIYDVKGRLVPVW